MQKVGRKAQVHYAKLGQKDRRRAQISNVGRILLYEIHPRSFVVNMIVDKKSTCVMGLLCKV
jgi:hypothetical protein